VASDVENSHKLRRAPKEGLKSLGILPHIFLGFQKLLTLLVVLGVLDRKGIDGCLSSLRRCHHEIKVRRELVVRVDELREIPSRLLAVAGQD
jgi:hypothetical protein